MARPRLAQIPRKGISIQRKPAGELPRDRNSTADRTVDGYIARLDDWAADIATALRGLIRAAAPKIVESIKWSQPVFESNGPVCYIKARRGYVNFGFWRGADLSDPEMLLEGTGRKMRHIKLRNAADIRPRSLKRLIREAVELNHRVGKAAKG